MAGLNANIPFWEHPEEIKIITPLNFLQLIVNFCIFNSFFTVNTRAHHDKPNDQR